MSAPSKAPLLKIHLWELLGARLRPKGPQNLNVAVPQLQHVAQLSWVVVEQFPGAGKRKGWMYIPLAFMYRGCFAWLGRRCRRVEGTKELERDMYCMEAEGAELLSGEAGQSVRVKREKRSMAK